MGDPFRGEVSWDRRGEDWVGVFPPHSLEMLRISANGLRKLIHRRVDEHAAGTGLGTLDRRLDALVWQYRIARSVPLPELEILIPIGDKLKAFLDAVPASGAVVVLHGWRDRYLWGTVALDLFIAFDAWVRAWRLGETVGGTGRPDARALAYWEAHRDWLGSQLIEPLKPQATSVA